MVYPQLKYLNKIANSECTNWQKLKENKCFTQNGLDHIYKKDGEISIKTAY